jgi:hypothetical protein
VKRLQLDIKANESQRTAEGLNAVAAELKQLAAAYKV